MQDQAQFEAKVAKDKKEGFRRWMQEPMARALISTLPPSENLEVLLEACYASGFGYGQGSMAVSFLEMALKDRPQR